ncbi:MAG: ABC transporter permease [Bacteroidales bacterium]|nr:ABC transporter permease [Bacteroidales bacterium]
MAVPRDKAGWTLVIRPKKDLLDIDLAGIWRYRDLWYMYVRRDIVTFYKQTVLGPLWFLVQPVLTTAMYMFVFGGLAGISTDGAPQPLFYLSGIMLWNYFSDSFNASSNMFTNNASVFGKVYFPRLVVPLAGLTSNLVKMGIQLILFVLVYIGYLLAGRPLQVHATLLLFPLYILLLAGHAMSWGLLISSVTSKYRDLRYLVAFGLQLFMYATPIIYPMTAASGRIRAVLELNPLTPVFESFKYGCLGCGSFSWGGLLYSTAFMLATLFLSIVVFNRVERNFMDTV